VGVHGSNTISQVGEFTANGAGQITSGLLDINDGGTATENIAITSGTYSIASTGRGTATIVTNDGAFPSLTFGFYVVSPGSARFVGTSTTYAVAGTAMQQAPNATFNLTSLNGNYAFLIGGSAPGGTIGTVGSFAADGKGHLTTGTLDENIDGTVTPSVAFSSGTYSVSSTGRGTATFTASNRVSPLTFVFYLGQTGSAVFQETDSNITSDGLFAQQQSTAFSLASIVGNYSVGLSGLSGSSAQVISGQLNANGVGIIQSGAIDINTAGTLTTGEAVIGSYSAPSTDGRATLSLNPALDNRNFAAYVVNSTELFVLGIDTGRLGVGTFFRQF
jgi:hypothetical protein